ncbi:MAG TPA: UMP kinase [Candidatus Moranbacteria bacterium]|nr:UMP kinase [Candidatus Moranbacteria bacterium]
MKQEKPIIISLGGSLIVPDKIDWRFLKKFRKVIVSQINKGKKFVIIAGGGKTCRNYQAAADKVVKLTNDDMDWLGIHATRLNAHLIKTIFRRYAHPRINKNPRTKEDLRKHFSKQEKIMVAAGWRPGWSTDFVATILAERLGAKTVINLSNIKYAYDKDPNKFKDAKKIEKINWTDFRKIVGNKWNPGANLPFDPIASKEAEKQGLKVIIADGKNIENLKDIFNNKAFKGTTIEN